MTSSTALNGHYLDSTAGATPYAVSPASGLRPSPLAAPADTFIPAPPLNPAGATLANLVRGDWPACTVIGARARIFLPDFWLARRLNKGAGIGKSDFASACNRYLTFTSINGDRLRGHALGILPTRWGFANKYYFVRSPWNRIYVFREPSPSLRVAREEARLWAENLQRQTAEPIINAMNVPSPMVSNGASPAWTANTLGVNQGQVPSTNREWYFFDLR